MFFVGSLYFDEVKKKRGNQQLLDKKLRLGLQVDNNKAKQPQTSS